MTDLGTLGGAASEAAGINNCGQVVGEAYTSSGAEHAFLYSGGTMQDLGTLFAGSNSFAAGINNSGLIVGAASTPHELHGNPPIEHAFLYSDGLMQDLNSLIAPTSGWTLNEANAINDSGQIVGMGVNLSGQAEAFLLNPVSEPATFTLLGSTLLGLGVVHLRRRKQKRSLHFAGESIVSSQDDPTSHEDGPAILSFLPRWTEATGRAA